MTDVLRYAAFTTDPAGGNPAGVVLDARTLGDAEMLAVAAEVGYSETAFLLPGPDPARARVRYFSPLAEVEFCGHATIATGVALAGEHGPGRFELTTNAGVVPVDVETGEGGLRARLTSVPTASVPATHDQVDEALAHLRWSRGDLGELPPHVAYAGARHLVLHARTRDRLADLDYDFDGLGDQMRRQGWTTVALVHPESDDLVHARNPFPVGGVVEDPATGAAAAAFGGYLRVLGMVEEPREIHVHQGDDLGRPSRLVVGVEPDDPRVSVSGAAALIA